MRVITIGFATEGQDVHTTEETEEGALLNLAMGLMQDIEVDEPPNRQQRFTKIKLLSICERFGEHTQAPCVSQQVIDEFNKDFATDETKKLRPPRPPVDKDNLTCEEIKARMCDVARLLIEYLNGRPQVTIDLIYPNLMLRIDEFVVWRYMVHRTSVLTDADCLATYAQQMKQKADAFNLLQLQIREDLGLPAG